MRSRSGFTLLEVALVLLILGTLLTAGVPRFRRALDAAAVRAARGELISAFAVTRAAAIRSGGASLIIDPSAGDVWIETAAGVRLPASYPLTARYGVVITSDRSPPVVLRYDPLGVGRLANATIRLHRRQQSVTLTVSAYGRIRS
jgi:prepilin-type N-terminal cleavage/methylation domain-containing protein